MTTSVDLMEVARELGEIAAASSDPETGRRLVNLVNRLLTAAGLPPDEEASGGCDEPCDWVHGIAESMPSV